jgi:hypothetical protein
MTMSPWSHSAMYVESALLRDAAKRKDIRRQFGPEARYLIVEACVPQDFDLSPYFDVAKFNARDPMEFDWVRED